MGTVTILEETTRNPITLIGKRAGVCWNSDITDDEKNYRRGIDCIKSGHGRVLEYVNVEMVIDGYSARVMREFERHHIGATFLQSSTRYVNAENFTYVCPKSLKDNEKAISVLAFAMSVVRESYSRLLELGIPKEDCAMVLPLGMATKIVDKRNLRSLVEMSRQRMCSRAYWEYRELFGDTIKALSEWSDEWKWVCDNLFYPKCEESGFCTEKNSCGRKPKKEVV